MNDHASHKKWIELSVCDSESLKSEKDNLSIGSCALSFTLQKLEWVGIGKGEELKLHSFRVSGLRM